MSINALVFLFFLNPSLSHSCFIMREDNMICDTNELFFFILARADFDESTGIVHLYMHCHKDVCTGHLDFTKTFM